MLENIKSKKSFAAIMTLAFAALVTCGVAAPTYAAPVAVSGLSTTTTANDDADDEDDTETAESSIPNTSAGTTTNPETADDTWLYALASLAITATALGGRYYFAKH